MKYVFSKPVTFEEKEYKDIEIDLESMNGEDLFQVKKQFTADGNFAPMLSTDLSFCSMLAARASHLPIEFFRELPIKDAMAISQAVTNFLLE